MLTYYHLWQMNPTEARRILVKDYQETGSYSQTAKNFANPPSHPTQMGEKVPGAGRVRVIEPPSHP